MLNRYGPIHTQVILLEEAGETFLRDEVEDFLNEIHPYFVTSSDTDGNNQTQVYGGDSTVEDSVQQAGQGGFKKKESNMK